MVKVPGSPIAMVDYFVLGNLEAGFVFDANVVWKVHQGRKFMRISQHRRDA